MHSVVCFLEYLLDIFFQCYLKVIVVIFKLAWLFACSSKKQNFSVIYKEPSSIRPAFSSDSETFKKSELWPKSGDRKENKPQEKFYKKRYSKKFHNIQRKALVLESLFNKIGVLQASSFVKKRLQHRDFLVNIAKRLRKLFIENTSGWLPLLRVI